MSSKIQRHTWGLRDALFQEWDALRAGKISVGQARASAALAACILKSVEVELQVVQHMNRAKPGELQAISREIRLGGA
jgi:hypothetical protein